MFQCLVVTALLVLMTPSAVRADANVASYIKMKCTPEYGRIRATEKAKVYAPLIEAAAKRHGLEPMLLASLVWHESNFNPKSRSAAGALGLCQVIPFAGRFKRRDPFDPSVNLDVGARLLRGYYDMVSLRYRGLPKEQLWHRALVAYNQGPAWVSRGVTRSRYSYMVLGGAKH